MVAKLTTRALCAAMPVPNPHSDRNAMIAATAFEHGMTVVTRKVADFFWDRRAVSQSI